MLRDHETMIKMTEFERMNKNKISNKKECIQDRKEFQSLKDKFCYYKIIKHTS
jgi:hypothetical protein